MTTVHTADEIEYQDLDVPSFLLDSEDEDEDESDETDHESKEDEAEPEEFSNKDSKREYKQSESPNKRQKTGDEGPKKGDEDWAWKISKKGLKYLEDMSEATYNTNPDAFGMFVYNDFHGYGIMEMMENQILAFGKEFKKKDCNWVELWYRVEAFAFYLTGGDDEWLMSDDGSRGYQILTLLGAMVFSTAAKAPSVAKVKKIKNLNTVIGLFCVFFSSWYQIAGDPEKVATWVPILVRWAKAHDVNVWNEKGDVESVMMMSSSRGKKKIDQWDETGFGKAVEKWAFTKTLNRVKKNSTTKFGGHEFDISRWSEAKKKANSLDLDEF